MAAEEARTLADAQLACFEGEAGLKNEPDYLMTLTADIVSAYISNNSVGVGDLPRLIQNVHHALCTVGTDQAEPKQLPAVPIRKSVTPDYLVCLEDGKKLKTMKRYLFSRYGMTPDEYRKKWGLRPDYPMVAPRYSEQRRALAKALGLGRRGRRKRKKLSLRIGS